MQTIVVDSLAIPIASLPDRLSSAIVGWQESHATMLREEAIHSSRWFLMVSTALIHSKKLLCSLEGVENRVETGRGEFFVPPGSL
jgi:hypothetical protein